MVQGVKSPGEPAPAQGEGLGVGGEGELEDRVVRPKSWGGEDSGTHSLLPQLAGESNHFLLRLRAQAERGHGGRGTERVPPWFPCCVQL